MVILLLNIWEFINHINLWEEKIFDICHMKSGLLTGLSALDNKRYVCDNNVHTLALGHYKIKL